MTINSFNILIYVCMVLVLPLLRSSDIVFADDWAMLGRDKTRNAVSPERQPPLDWNIGAFDRETGEWIKEHARHIKWTARLGSTTFGTPVVADGHVYIGTNNGGGYTRFMLEYLPNRETAVAEMVRVCRPGGQVMLQDLDGQLAWHFPRDEKMDGRSSEF